MPNSTPATAGPVLTGIPETLVMPLWGRATETLEPHGLIRDEKAVEMWAALKDSFGQFTGDWRLQVKVAVRTFILDKATAGFVQRNPEGLVVNIGAGLDTRFHRVDNGRIRWFDLDLPEVISLRRRFFPETERQRMLACSVFETGWPALLGRQGEPVLLIAEGVFPYFEEAQVRQLVEWLAGTFPGAELLMEATTPTLVRRNQRDAGDRFKKAKLKWGIVTGRDLAGWRGCTVLEEWTDCDYLRGRWQGWWWWTTFPPLKNHWHNHYLRLRLG